MEVAALMSRGEVAKAGEILKDSIRKAPSDPTLRSLLHQLNVLTGKWEAAATQLEVYSGLEPKAALYALVQRKLLECEAERRAVFCGERQPTLFGTPEEWMGYSVHAAALAGRGEWGAAMDLQARALERAEAVSGALNGERFQWIADGDARLGPLLEVFVEGRYWWVPLCRLRMLKTEGPRELLDTVWLPARFTWANGGGAEGFVPVRYPGSETSPDPDCRLARKTLWTEVVPGMFTGDGQRMLLTDGAELGVLDLRQLELDVTVPE
jgi:type VI secretion system protein ImpE